DKPPHMAEQSVPRFFLALMLGAAVLLAFVLTPLAAELVLAAVFAAVLWPAQQGLSRRFRGKRGIAAGVVTLLVVVMLIGPVATIVTFVVRDGADGVRFISEALRSDEVAALVDYLPEGVRTSATAA